MLVVSVLVITLFITVAIGVPITLSIGIASFLALIVSGNVSVLIMAQRMYTGGTKYALLAIFFFILAGNIMQRGGIARRLVDFSNTIFGPISGGLSIVTIVTCMFFAAISGSAIATTAAIGGILFPALIKANYPADYAAAVPAAAGTLGTVIPPSISFVLYGSITNTSISQLLMSGVIPGVLAGIALCIYAYIYARKHKFPRENKSSLKQIAASFVSAFWALLMPIIILGGIYLGVFTPTESASVAVFYGLLISFFIYREMDFDTLKEVAFETVRSTANIMLLVMSATIFSWLLTINNVPVLLSNFVISKVSGPITFLLLINILFIILGMFMENGAIIVILAPLLAPIAVKLGINPVHFGLVVVFNLAVGQATPPFGTCLFAAVNMSGQSIVGISKKVLPLCLVLFVVVFLSSYVPSLALWLPSIMIGK
jgi:C4-dicarboxylate transporter DctM subunit